MINLYFKLKNILQNTVFDCIIENNKINIYKKIENDILLLDIDINNKLIYYKNFECIIIEDKLYFNGIEFMFNLNFLLKKLYDITFVQNDNNKRNYIKYKDFYLISNKFCTDKDFNIIGGVETFNFINKLDNIYNYLKYSKFLYYYNIKNVKDENIYNDCLILKNNTIFIALFDKKNVIFEDDIYKLYNKINTEVKYYLDLVKNNNSLSIINPNFNTKTVLYTNDSKNIYTSINYYSLNCNITIEIANFILKDKFNLSYTTKEDAIIKYLSQISNANNLYLENIIGQRITNNSSIDKKNNIFYKIISPNKLLIYNYKLNKAQYYDI